MESSILRWSTRLGVEAKFVIEDAPNLVTKNTMETIRGLNAQALLLKKENLAQLISKAREEIRSLQSKLFSSEAEIAVFEPYFECGVMDDKTLEAHDAEVERLTAELEGKKQLLILFEARTDLLSKLTDIRRRETDPNRFKNRQAQLLLDDQEKKKLCNVGFSGF